ncbi:hypothetical protein CYFUS_008870 [Cystobacter fuscus]|uniref:Lipoprotein n=2 Tax=Cystobacter fuscus TaxID=43 RepID=A0A250JID6_9BACT|nr:hypothetical protein CYFUS_008870 [Cystobacter fuscus]
MLLVLAVLVFLEGCATGASPGSLTSGMDLHLLGSATPPILTGATGGAGGFSMQTDGSPAGGALACGGVPVPPGWPDLSSGDSEALLAPFLACASPGEYVALQQRVDMPRLVEALDDWSAVRLGALGPVREDAAAILHRKRVSFLLAVTERYGLFYAEVFALFVLHSAHDDDVAAVLRLLAQDKQLGQTLALMPAVREELEARGLSLSAYPERGERASDVLRGLGRAARDALSSSLASDGARYTGFSARREQLPAPYRDALHEVERALALRHFAPGSVAVGSLDAATFGVPLGFYYLVAGTGQGLSSLSQGQYEQATRELAPAMLLGALYAGGRSLRVLSEARGTTVGGTHRLHGLQAMQLRLRGLEEVARRLEGLLGGEGMRELARDIRASREAGRFVAVGGVDAALALHEARGDVARAQALMSKARPGATGSSAVGRGAARTGGLASLVDEHVGLTREVVEAKLARVELEATGPRLSRDVTVLERQRPAHEVPPPEARGNPRWREYVDYYERRLGELKEGKSTKGPLRWENYERMWGWFARGLTFERLMVKVLREDALLPRAQRRFLGDFNKPRVEANVGVWKPGPGLRYADVLVIEEGGSAGRPPRVETFSFKSRDLSGLGPESLTAQMVEDAREALRKYGETVDIRRDSLQSLLRGDSKVPVPRVRLIYEGGELKPSDVRDMDAALIKTQEQVPGVEVFFQ